MGTLMCEGCFGLDGDLAEVCGRIRAATAAVPTSDWTVAELGALAELLESVAAARVAEVFQVSLAEVISIDSARGRPVLSETQTASKIRSSSRRLSGTKRTMRRRRREVDRVSRLAIRPDGRRKLRERCGVAHDRDVAERLGVDPTQVSRVLSGKHPPANRFIAGVIDRCGLEFAFEHVFQVVPDQDTAS